MESVCSEHSSVMKTLGGLDRGQTDIKETLASMNCTLIEIRTLQNNGVVKGAVEKTKTSMLYWVIAIAAGGFIVGLINMILKPFSR